MRQSYQEGISIPRARKNVASFSRLKLHGDSRPTDQPLVLFVHGLRLHERDWQDPTHPPRQPACSRNEKRRNPSGFRRFSLRRSHHNRVIGYQHLAPLVAATPGHAANQLSKALSEPGLISLISFVPASVPLVFHNSEPRSALAATNSATPGESSTTGTASFSWR